MYRKFRATMNQENKLFKGDKRILVYLKKNGVDKTFRLANFAQSVVDYFYDDHRHVGEVSVVLNSNRLEVDDSKETAIKIKRPSFCPISNISDSDIEKLPDDIRGRGIDVGAAVILESSDSKVLLTRRAKTLRTFPNIWVPPGGHLEENETFVEAGLRELKEETGLDLQPSDCVSGNVSVLALWESVFPPKLEIGLPKRHHVVVYLHGKLKNGHTADNLNTKMKLQPAEVGACAWVDRDLIQAITSAKEDEANVNVTHTLPNSIRGFTVNESGIQTESDILVEPLLRVSGVSAEIERVSTGTKFALEEWLKLL